MRHLIVNSNPFGPLPPDRLEAFEARIGDRLPEPYRSFLLEHNGGVPANQSRIYGGQAFGLHDGPPELRLDSHFPWEHSVSSHTSSPLVPLRHLLPFAEAAGGLWCLALRRPR